MRTTPVVVGGTCLVLIVLVGGPASAGPPAQSQPDWARPFENWVRFTSGKAQDPDRTVYLRTPTSTQPREPSDITRQIGEPLAWYPSQVDQEQRKRELLKQPGPQLAGRFDAEMFYWMDSERLTQGFTADYRGRQYFDSDVVGQSGQMSWREHDAVIRYDDPATGGPSGAFAKMRVLDFDKRPILPSTGQRFPAQLYDFQVHGMMPVPYVLGDVSVAFGSASDQPFASDNEMIADITWLTGSLPTGQEEGAVFFVNFQNNRDFLNGVPLPGFEYRCRRLWDQDLTVLAGFPFDSVAWRPIDAVELSASYAFPQQVHAEAAWLPIKAVRVFASFDWTDQHYFLAGRDDVRDRLWYVEKRLTAGVRWTIRRDLWLEAGAGWAFDRSWFEGHTLQDRHGAIDLADGPFVGIQLDWRF
jgi:hypothetical protein